MTKESMQNHIKHLEEQHKELKLDLMEADVRGDELTAQKIKKQKLKLKDKIESCKKQLQSL